MKRQSQQGIALVITLILLSVITFMTVTFLVISRHEGEQVDTTTQQNVAKFAADGMEQQAAAQIVALMLGQTNGYNFGLLVSTNYITPGGYDPTITVRSNLTEVSYYYQNGNPLNQADQLQMLNNLLYLPRAPVFVTTNKNAPPDFRFYNDLNGNGYYDTNGVITNLDPTGQILKVGVNPVVTMQTGDPEWIGFLEHPDWRHSPSNMFLSRGAFIAVPIGNALDMNYIHNQAKRLGSGSDGYMRNQGVGSWELNLAAFLHTLNTNWDFYGTSYSYNSNSLISSSGTSFVDAASILEYRYNNNYGQLNNFQAMYPVSPGFIFGNYYIDGYSAGPLLTNVGPLTSPPYPAVINPIGNVWSGADNPVQFFGARDLLTMIPGVTPLTSFTNHLYSVGTNLDTYDRYTFYRMLAQMGVGSAPEPAPYPIGGGTQVSFTGLLPMPIPANTQIGVVASTGATGPGGRNQMSFGSIPEAYPYPHGHRINLNYNNLGVNGVALAATNFVPWTSTNFFTNAADRLLRTYFPTNIAIVMGGQTYITNININFIPIYPVNYYTPAVHRLLQVAANIYDASTNKNNTGFDYPSVFRPYFAKTNSGTGTLVYINGYTEAAPPVGSTVLPANCLTAPLDLRRPGDLIQVASAGPDMLNNIYGVPYVIGARTNLPNFNQFSMASVVQITRTLQFTRTSPTAPISSYITNVAYTIGISNVVGMQCWNSYTNSFYRPGGVRILAVDDFSLQVTNSIIGGVPVNSNGFFGLSPQYALVNSTQINPWPNGLSNGQFVVASFAVPMFTNITGLPTNSALLPNGSYSTNGTFFSRLQVSPTTGSYFPDWGINMTNRVRLIIQDNATGRILDYVQLGGLGQLSGLDSQDTVISNLSAMNLPPGNNIWDTNAIGTNASGYNSLPRGIFNQYEISLGAVTVSPSYWSSSPSGSSPASIQLAIQGFRNWLTGSNTANQTQLPFTATTAYGKVYTWSANDPLVHYTVGDLTDLTKTGAANVPVPLTVGGSTNVLSGLVKQSSRYRPWGNTTGLASPLNNITSDYLEYVDPQMTQSSAWQFPTNKYPNVGWLGRVHRGTPWQTIYLKAHSQAFANAAWQYWTGNSNAIDAANTQPANDWQMLDLFTTAPNDNASRGQMSVNQTNIAAWAALLDGVVVLSNGPAGPIPMTIDTTPPTGIGQFIISQINAYRSTLPNQVFTSVGQLLGVPQLSSASPYLNTANNANDVEYEWIPQQIMGLIRVGTPRYAIYSYGQALKPANNSIVQSGASFGLCTNYQITGEALTRTIVRFDNMPVPGQALPGTTNVYALPVQGSTPPSYVMVTNILPPVRAVVESYSILGPDQ